MLKPKLVALPPIILAQTLENNAYHTLSDLAKGCHSSSNFYATVRLPSEIWQSQEAESHY